MVKYELPRYRLVQVFVMMYARKVKLSNIVFIIPLVLAVLALNSTPSVTSEKPGIPVLSYHQVTSDQRAKQKNDEFIMGISEFKKQMKWLKDRGYKTVSLKEFYDFIKNGKKPGVEKPILITFDDGSAGHYFYARKALNEAGFKGVFFVFVRGISYSKSYLSWEQLKVMIKEGHSVENHTYGHGLLTTMSYEEQVKDLTKAREVLKKKLDIDVRWLAHPFGDFNTDSLRALAATNHFGAFTVFLGENEAKTNPYLLNRYLVLSTDSMDTFEKSLKIKHLPLGKLSQERGSIVNVKKKLEIQLGMKIKPESLRVEAGRKFNAPNKSHPFSYQKETNTITILPEKRTTKYFIIHIYAEDLSGKKRQVSLLYLWK